MQSSRRGMRQADDDDEEEEEEEEDEDELEEDGLVGWMVLEMVLPVL